MQEPNQNQPAQTEQQEPEFYNFFHYEKLSLEEYTSGCQLSHLTRKVIQNKISEAAIAILNVHTDIQQPLQSEIHRSYLKGIIDAYTTLLSLETSNSEGN